MTLKLIKIDLWNVYATELKLDPFSLPAIPHLHIYEQFFPAYNLHCHESHQLIQKIATLMKFIKFRLHYSFWRYYNVIYLMMAFSVN